jgi:RHS repeat-associated protein
MNADITAQRLDSYINLHWYGSRWYDAELGRFIQPDSIVPEAVQGIQSWNRYAYANNNPLAYTDPSGHVAWFVTGAIGAAIGGIIGGALYYAKNRNSFDWGECGAAAGAGAIAGGLIGSGVGLIAAPATSAALATAATAITGAGTGAAGSAIGYTVTNPDTFDTTSFVETTAVGGTVGAVSAVTPANGLGVAIKATTYIAGSESLYALQTDNWTVEGAQQAAISGAIGAGFDVVGTLAVQSIGPQILSGVYPSKGPQGFLPPKGNQDILKVAARYRSGADFINAGSGIATGFGSYMTSWLLNRQIKAE